MNPSDPNNSNPNDPVVQSGTEDVVQAPNTEDTPQQPLPPVEPIAAPEPLEPDDSLNTTNTVLPKSVEVKVEDVSSAKATELPTQVSSSPDPALAMTDEPSEEVPGAQNE